MPNYNSITPWYSQRESIKKVIIENGVTNIGDYAFMNCFALTSITIPNSVTTIGHCVFLNCSSLASIISLNSVTNIGYRTFEGTKWYEDQPDGLVYAGLLLYKYKGTMPVNTKIVVKEGTKKILDSAFSGCSGLTSITIPSSVTSIGGAAFSDCSGLKSVEIPESVTSIGENAFFNSGLTSVTIPNSMTSIGNRTFERCDHLTSVIIGNSVTSIGDAAFMGCSNLISVTIGNSVTSIGEGTFSCCSSLTSITIPNSVTDIRSCAFYDCSALTSVTMGNSVNHIGRIAFSVSLHKNITTVSISDVVSWCKIKFDSYDANPLYRAEHLYLNGNEVNNLVVPDGVTGIGAYSFYNCKSITSVEIPNTVTSIGNQAFYNCSGLTSLTIPESVTSVGGAALEGAKLRNIVIKAKTPPSGESAFSDQSYNHATLMVPEGSWDAYAYSDDIWYKFINIREMAYNAVNLTNSKAYTMKSATEGAYLFYDSVNDCVAALNETALDDTEENVTWMTTEVDGKHYVYNLGAKKFLVADKTNAKTGYRLSDVPASIDIEDGKDAIVFGKGKEFYMVINEKLNVDEGLESQIMTSTGINEIDVKSNQPTITYNLNGQRINHSNAQKGVYIKNGKKYAK